MADYSANLVVKVSQPSLESINQLEQKLQKISNKVNELTNKTFNPFAQQVTALRAVNRLLKSNLELNNKYNTVLKATTQELERAAKATKKVEKGGALAGGAVGRGDVGGVGGADGGRATREREINRIMRERLDIANRAATIYELEASKAELQGPVWEKVRKAKEEIARGADANLTYINALLRSASQLLQIEKKRNKEQDDITAAYDKEIALVEKLTQEKLRAAATEQRENDRILAQVTRESELRIKETERRLKAEMDAEAKLRREQEKRNKANFQRGTSTLKDLGTRVDRAFGGALSSIENIGVRAGVGGLGLMAAQGLAAADSFEIVGRSVFELQGPIGEAIKLIGNMDQNLGLAAVAAMAFAPQIKKVGEGAWKLGQGAVKAAGGVKDFVQGLSSMDMELGDTTAGVAALNREMEKYRNLTGASAEFRNFQQNIVPEVQARPIERPMMDRDIQRVYNRSSAGKAEQRAGDAAFKEAEAKALAAERAELALAEAAKKAAEAVRRQARALTELGDSINPVLLGLQQYKALTESINAVEAASANLQRTRADYFDTTSRSMQVAIQKTREYTQVINELNGLTRAPARQPALRPAGMTDADVRTLNEAGAVYRENALGQPLPPKQFGPAANPGTDRKATRDALNAEVLRTQEYRRANALADQLVASKDKWNAAVKEGTRETAEQVALAKEQAILDRMSAASLKKKVEQRKKERGVLQQIGRDLQANAKRQQRAGKEPGLLGRMGASMGKEGFDENFALGVGFPLLFGGGPGSILGSGIGSFFGKGFGGQILGGAIGQIFDDMVAKAGQLGNAIMGAADSAEALRDALVPVSGEIEFQAEQMKALQGDVAGAGELLTGELTKQTGDIGGEGAKGAAAVVNEVTKAWNGMANAAATFVGIIGAPVAGALAVILRGVQAILFLFNALGAGIAKIFDALAGSNRWFRQMQENTIKGTAEYEKQQAALLRQTSELEEQSKWLDKQNKTRKDLIKASSAEYKFALRMEKLEELRKNQVLEMRELRKNENGRTEEERARELKLRGEMEKKQASEIAQFWLQEQRNVQEQVAQWNLETTRKNEDTIRQEATMRLQIARANADLELSAIRKIEDARLRLRELQAQAGMRAIELAQEELSIRLEIAYTYEKFLNTTSTTPNLDNFITDIEYAIKRYEQGILNAEEKAAAKREQIAVRAERARLQLQRYLEDSDTRIARMNFDNAKKIEEINIRIQRRQEDFQRKSLVAMVEAQVKIEEARNTARLKAIQALSNDLAFLDSPAGLATPEWQRDALKAAYGKKQAEYNAEVFQSIQLVNELKKVLSGVDVPLALKEFNVSDKFVGISEELRKEMAELDQLFAKLEAQMAVAAGQNEGKKGELEFIRAITGAVQQQAQALQGAVEAEDRRLAKLNEVRRIVNEEGLYGQAAEQLAELSLNQEIFNGMIDQALVRLRAMNDDPAVAELIEKLEKVKELSEAASKVRAEQIAQTQTFEYQVQVDGIDQAKQKLAELQDPAKLVIASANMIGDAFGEAFKNIVSGSMSAQEAFHEMTKKMADFFLDMAAKMIAEYVKLIIMQTILNAIGGPKFNADPVGSQGNPFGNVPGGSMPGGPAVGGGRIPLNAANGGRGRQGEPIIVGERGPELFTPDTAGTISSNRFFDAARDSMSIDADTMASNASEQRENNFYEAMQSPEGREMNVRYESTVINEVEYVTADQFQRGMKDTATRARAETLKDLRNYPGKRAAVGMR